MKKIIYNCIYGFTLCAVIAMIMSSCQDEADNATATITEVRNYGPSPTDTTVQTVQVGQWLVLLGNNMNEVSYVLFGGVPASTNNTLFTDNSIVIQVPDIPFQTVSSEELHKITVITKGGSSTFPIQVVGVPLITRVRNADAAPNDTTLTSIAPGQRINIIGFNLKNAASINFQGVDADLSDIVYTDSSVVVTTPSDFSAGDGALANKITYTTNVGASTFFIPIFDPAILETYKNELWELLSGGIGKEKTWTIDFNAAGVSKKFAGPLGFSGDELRWDHGCAKDGGNCWSWEPPWQSWMPAPKDYGTMTFKIKGVPVLPTVTVTQKGLDTASKNGTFSGGYFLDAEAKTLSFSDATPLNLGWDNVDWSKAYLISLTADGMTLGFKHKGKAELELYYYIPK